MAAPEPVSPNVTSETMAFSVTTVPQSTQNDVPEAASFSTRDPPQLLHRACEGLVSSLWRAAVAVCAP